MAVGTLAGTAVGVFVIGRCDTRDDALWVGCGYGHFMGGLAGAGAGMFIGGVLGRWWPKERWRPARLPLPVTLSSGLTNLEADKHSSDSARRNGGNVLASELTH